MRTRFPGRLPPILCYHRIAEAAPGESHFLAVRPERFREQLGFLRRRGYQAFSLDEILNRLARRERLPRKAFAITLDDGYRDHHEHAMPILRSLSMSATAFVVTGLVGSRSTFDADVGEPPHPLLTWDEIEEMHSQGIHFGSHSATHRILTGLSDGELLQELVRSRDCLEDATGSRVGMFSYPRGGRDPRVIAFLRRAGYRGAVTVETGPGADLFFELPRVTVFDWDVPVKLWLKMLLRRNYLLGRDLRRVLPGLEHL